MTDKILSIQSKLVYGYVGSNIAELAVQLHGLDIIAFPTVYLAAHTGHQPSYGMRVNRELFDDLITGVKNLDIVKDVALLISGYIGEKGILDSAIGFIKEIKAEHPQKLYICDPVMGDVQGLYVEKQLAEAIIAKLLPACDIMTPNHFEFEYIVGKKVRTREEVADTIAAHPILKDKVVVITSCHLSDVSNDKIETLIVQQGTCTSVLADKVAINTTGTGDLFTAVLAAQLALGSHKNVVAAANQAAEVVQKALSYCVDNGLCEMNAKSLLRSIV